MDICELLQKIEELNDLSESGFINKKLNTEKKLEIWNKLTVRDQNILFNFVMN